MNLDATSPKTDSQPSRGLRALHIFVLCSFAFTQPSLAALSRQTVYLHDQKVGFPEVAVLLAILTIVLPLGCVFIDGVALHSSRRLGRWSRNAVLMILVGLIVLSVLRPSLRVTWLIDQLAVWIPTLAIAFPASWLLVRLYERTSWLRQWLTVASPGLVLFPGLFLWQLADIRQSPPGSLSRIPLQNPVPVVLVVFDEFSGTTLMDEQLQIDSQRFPQFARLADLSTWYRHATTVHPRTDDAVPAILSGQFPTTHRNPLEVEFPGNLFQVIQATGAFDMVVFEPMTRLCPLSVRQRIHPYRSSFQRTANLLQTVGTVYPRLVLPGDMPITFPAIPKPWFGLPEEPLDNRDQTKGLFQHNGFADRPGQLHHFLNCLPASDRPRFAFLHVELPHVPWCYLPSGSHYIGESDSTCVPDGALGELGEDWEFDPAVVLRNEHRYLQQVGYVDRFIGQLLDRLQETQTLDRCLLIVAADHGVSFRTKHSRRIPDADNLPDILSVPLFIKLPGQTTGRVDDRNVESVDILPTIAEVLGLNLPEPVDGVSVSQEVRRPRKTLYFEDKMTVVEPSFPQLKAAVQRRHLIHGPATGDRPPAQATSHPAWHGRRLSDFTLQDRPIPSLVLHEIGPDQRIEVSPFVPCLVRGSLDPSELPESSADLVLAVDGVICDSGKSYKSNYGLHGFQFFLPEPVATQSPGQAELLLVEPSTEALPRLRRLSRWTLRPQK